tara:strand:+ start:782 stop:1705 length:924 start_codon:yes stop_codon:yes gene_type:complete
MPSNSQVREQITQQIVEAIESGSTLPWRMPWKSDSNAGMPRNVISKQTYSGINPLLLWVASERLGLQSKWWGTFKQWTELGFQIKKRPNDVPSGRWGSKIIFYKPVKKKVDEESKENEKIESYLLAKQITLFCADQVEGAEQFQVGNDPPTHFNDYDLAEQLIAATGATIIHDGHRAYFNSKTEEIVVPQKHKFESTGAYYATILHELAHWSENRTISDPLLIGYAQEELVAELCATFLCAELGVPQTDSLDNHAAYLVSWLKQMAGDSSFIFRASRQASYVANFLLSFLPEKQGELQETNIAIAQS